jgi:dGTPase
LSYATLGAFTKYPKESLPKKPTKNIADKKYGFFQSDVTFFKEVAEELGMISNKTGDDVGYERHPLAFLVEAADDICYTIIDFEDGINLGLVSEDYALEYLIKLVKDTIDAAKYQTLTTKEDRISYLRALAIGNLINDAVRVFIENEEAILAGKFHFALTDKSKYKAQMDDIIKLSVKNIYQSREVIEKELSGYQIINNLLDKFITAYNNTYNGCATNYDKLLMKILPEKHHLEKENLYDRLLHICHFISMLTDGKAVQLNKIVTA